MYVLPFSDRDVAPANITCHLIYPKNPGQRVPSEFVNQTRSFSHQKNIDLIVNVFFSHKYQFMDVYMTAS